MATPPQILSFQQAMEEVADRLGGRRKEMDRIEDLLNEAQLWLARSDVPLPPLETLVTVTLMLSQAEYSITSDLHIVDRIGFRSIRNQDVQLGLAWFAWKDYRRISQQATGSPTRVTTHGDRIAFDPIPNSQPTLLIDYRRQPVLGRFELDVTWLEWWISIAVHLCWKALNEPALAQSAFNTLPPWLQARLTTPMTENEWQAMWDDELGMVASPYAQM